MKKLILLLSGLFIASSALYSQPKDEVKKYKAQKTLNYGEIYFGWNN